MGETGKLRDHEGLRCLFAGPVDPENPVRRSGNPLPSMYSGETAFFVRNGVIGWEKDPIDNPPGTGWWPESVHGTRFRSTVAGKK
jgi:hypothetical protein